jgi:catechol 2,3-dioxygenase-like lactoylglutathione lyase family enzyme
MTKSIRLQHVSSPYPPDRQEEVRAFYGTLLGLHEIMPPSSLAHIRLVWFSSGSDDLELHLFPAPVDPSHARHVALEVEDLEALRNKLLEAGYEPYDTTPIPNRPRFFCRDPFGNLIEFTTLLVIVR